MERKEGSGGKKDEMQRYGGARRSLTRTHTRTQKHQHSNARTQHAARKGTHDGGVEENAGQLFRRDAAAQEVEPAAAVGDV